MIKKPTKAERVLYEMKSSLYNIPTAIPALFSELPDKIVRDSLTHSRDGNLCYEAHFSDDSILVIPDRIAESFVVNPDDTPAKNKKY